MVVLPVGILFAAMMLRYFCTVKDLSFTVPPYWPNVSAQTEAGFAADSLQRLVGNLLYQ
jgi:hypothetical protein